MSYAISYTNEFYIFTFTGECLPGHVEEAVRPIINNPDSEINKSLLIDARQVTNVSTTEEIREFVRIYQSMPFRRIAITVNNPTHFGMARMFGSYAEVSNKQEVAVFYGVTDAQVWLSEK